VTHSGHAALWSAFPILRISHRLAAFVISLLLLSQNSGQALLRSPKIGTGVERSAEIVQSQICLAEQLIRLSAFRKRNGILRLGSQCFAKIIDRLLVVAQGEVKATAIESTIGLWGIARYPDRIIRDGIVIVSKLRKPCPGCNRQRQSRAST
jgi:hypothetical protein